MAHLEEIPLFPLHTVLFPHASLHLNVFEERYHQMLRYCLEYDQPFGIVLIRSGSEVGGAAEPYMVGTACRIVTRSRSSTSSAFPASKRGMSVRLAPAATAEFSPKKDDRLQRLDEQVAWADRNYLLHRVQMFFDTMPSSAWTRKAGP